MNHKNIIIPLIFVFAIIAVSAGCTQNAEITSKNTTETGLTLAQSTTEPTLTQRSTPPDNSTIIATWVSKEKVSKFDEKKYSLEYSFVDGGRGILVFYDNNDKYLFEEPFGWECIAVTPDNCVKYNVEYFVKLSGKTDEFTLNADKKFITDSNGNIYEMSKLSQVFV